MITKEHVPIEFNTRLDSILAVENYTITEDTTQLEVFDRDLSKPSEYIPVRKEYTVTIIAKIVGPLVIESTNWSHPWLLQTVKEIT